MKILAIIPARGGSKGIPNKNIKLLGNKPLLQYTSDIALQSKAFDKVVLSSDSDAIIKIAKNLGVEVPFKRPDSLAEDTTPTLPVIQHVLDFYESRGEFFDAVCLLQVTSPFRTVSFLDQAITTFIAKNTDSLISVQKVPHEFNPHWTFEVTEEGFLSISTGESKLIPRRQELPIAYHRDGSIYLTKTSVIKQNSLYGDSIAYVQSPKESAINIDTLKDWIEAEKYLNL